MVARGSATFSALCDRSSSVSCAKNSVGINLTYLSELVSAYVWNQRFFKHALRTTSPLLHHEN
jgi:hypothetical protein